MPLTERVWKSAGVWLVVGGLSLLVMTAAMLRTGRFLHGSDDLMYYCAARSLVFAGDLDVTDDFNAAPGSGSIEQRTHYIRRNAAGRIIHRMPIGLSLIESVPLAAARGVRAAATACGVDVSGPPGYSALEGWLVSAFLVLWTALGMQLLFGMAREIAPPAWAWFCVVATWLGTSLFCYSTVFVTMSHGAAFTLVLAIVTLMNRAPDWQKPNRALTLAGILGALLVLVRPQQVLLGFLVAPRLVALRGRPRAAWAPGLIAAIGIVAAAALWQWTINRQNFGAAVAHAYVRQGEHFNWWFPGFLGFYVGGNAGLLFASPLVVVAVAGYLVSAPRRWGWPATVLLAQGIVQALVVSLWWGPDNRMWTESTGMVALGLALWHRRGPLTRGVVLGLAAWCVCWSLAYWGLRVFDNRAIRQGSTRSVARAMLDLPRRAQRGEAHGPP